MKRIAIIVAGFVLFLAAVGCEGTSPVYYYDDDSLSSGGNDTPYYPPAPSGQGEEEVVPGYAPDGYTLVWNDEFNDPSSLSGKWLFEKGGTGWGNNELEYYCSGGVFARTGQKTASISDGTLKIKAYKVTAAADTDNKEYVSARMMTSASWQYGYIEMRAKLPAPGGCWPAFWMLLKDGPSYLGDGGGELDIMEWVANDPGFVHFSAHSEKVTRNSGQYYVDPVTGKSYKHSEHIAISNPSTEFHCFGMEWTHEYIKAFMDGVQYYYAPNPVPEAPDLSLWPFDQKYYLKLNLAIGGSWGGKVAAKFDTATYEIDWVRVYQK